MAKHLVICFDGTWNSADSEKAETNVARLARAVQATSGGVQQITLYLRGVGSTGIALQRLVEGATGDGIDDNIRAGYMFLAQNFVPGDRIFLFGFSRGAFTARSLAGFIGVAGLLQRSSLGDMAKAWAYYRTPKAERPPGGFCAATGAVCHDAKDVAIDFLGVWDTVGALGIPSDVLNGLTAHRYQFHDTEPSRIVKVGRHALAIDEHRDEFEPTLWTGTVPPGVDIRQTWFAGAHSDVGGGYAERLLADIPLQWMAEEAMRCGLKLDEGMLPPRLGGALDPRAPQHESRKGWSAKDLLTPTIRQVQGAAVDTGPFERLSRPRGPDGAPLAPINEELHPSVRARYGQPVLLLPGREDGAGERITYRPKNLAPLLG